MHYKNVFIWERSFIMKNFFAEKTFFTEKNINEKKIYIYIYLISKIYFYIENVCVKNMI